MLEPWQIVLEPWQVVLTARQVVLEPTNFVLTARQAVLGAYWQLPDTQLWPVAQAWPQAPQFAGSVSRFVSQGVDGSPSQSAYGGVHAQTPQTPPTQIAQPPPEPHACPQPPQLFTSAARFVSQPLVGFPSQSPQPGSHLGWQAPAMHWARACWVPHTMPQPPQLFTSFETLVSQPSAQVPLQLA